MSEKLIAIVGPTAVGKTNLSIDLAKRFNGEIISGDSMQVYKGMDIGTAKVKTEEQQGIRHHLIDIIHPTEDFSVNQFQEKAIGLIKDINERGSIPILVGGTGLYVQSITHHFQFPKAGESADLRAKWQQYLDTYGPQLLYQELLKIDPKSAERLHPNNSRRIIRALEVRELTGESISNHQKDWDKDSPYDLFMIGLTMERAKLYQRINLRVDMMVKEGLIEETENLLQQGVPQHATALQAIGYKEIIEYLQGNITKDAAIEQLKQNTRRFAKRQLTWFRRMKDIRWFDMTDLSMYTEIKLKITNEIAGEWKDVENI